MSARNRAYTEIRASAILTNSYVAASEVNTKGKRRMALHFAFTKGSLTDCQIKLQYSEDGGTTWRDVLLREAHSSGVTTQPNIEILLLNADLTGSLVYDVEGYDVVRPAAIGTGTVTSSLLQMAALVS